MTNMAKGKMVVLYSIFQSNVFPANMGTTVVEPKLYSFGTVQFLFVNVIFVVFLGNP